MSRKLSMVLLCVVLALAYLPTATAQPDGPQIALGTPGIMYVSPEEPGQLAWFEDDLDLTIQVESGDVAELEVTLEITSRSNDVWNWLLFVDVWESHVRGPDEIEKYTLELNTVEGSRNAELVYVLDTSFSAGTSAEITLLLHELNSYLMGCNDSCAFVPESMAVKVQARDGEGNTGNDIRIFIPIQENLDTSLHFLYPYPYSLLHLEPVQPTFRWQLDNFTYDLEIDVRDARVVRAVQVQVDHRGAYEPYWHSRDWIRKANGDYDLRVHTFRYPETLQPGEYMWWLAVAHDKPNDNGDIDRDLVSYYGPFYFTVSDEVTESPDPNTPADDSAGDASDAASDDMDAGSDTSAGDAAANGGHPYPNVANEDDYCAPLQGPDIFASVTFEDDLLCGNHYLQLLDDGTYGVYGRYRVVEGASLFGRNRFYIGFQCTQVDNLTTGELGIAGCLGGSSGREPGDRWRKDRTDFPAIQSGDTIRTTYWIFRIDDGERDGQFLGFTTDTQPTVNGINLWNCGSSSADCQIPPDIQYAYRYQTTMQVP